MAIIGFDPDHIIDFIPTYGGNRDAKEPIVVCLKYVPYKRVLHYSRILARELQNATDASAIDDARDALNRRQFCEAVDSVKNCEVVGSDGVRAVSTPEEFYDVADNALIKELIGAMENAQRLNEGQRKN